ncbi:hypothetical protein [Oceanobacillus picturae]|uniref:hypothetical protein n=1 Tax=Oceanobacillus picturae TaxID=171693 RepID=UPI0005686607|nr:hypothetical protein [Oceanobacillus picturae]RIU89098.1 hypothetical protein D1864_16395 [Oceanobacillus picturae]
MTRILRAHVRTAPGHARWLHVVTQSDGFNGAFLVGDKGITMRNESMMTYCTEVREVALVAVCFELDEQKRKALFD